MCFFLGWLFVGQKYEPDWTVEVFVNEGLGCFGYVLYFSGKMCSALLIQWQATSNGYIAFRYRVNEQGLLIFLGLFLRRSLSL